jgi:hypothetical protein
MRGTVSVRVLPKGRAALGVLLDLSKGGCGIELGEVFAAAVDAEVEVEMFVRGVRLQRAGIVRYMKISSPSRRETRLGIEFVEEGSEAAEHFHLQTKGFWTQSHEFERDDQYEPILRKLWAHLSRSRE